MERHRAAVSRIAASVRSFFDRKEAFRVFHGSTNTTRPLNHKHAVDISALHNVLSVDAAKRTCLVEPNVPMDRLVEHTLRHGLVPPVVMEFPGITCGGGFAGTAGESSSFKYGFFDENVNSVEMVLADGEVVTASRASSSGGEGSHVGLFRGAAGAVGTLGITTLLELRLVAAKRFVRTTYRRTNSVAEAVAAVKDAVARGESDYVDGILFSKRHGAVVTATMTDEKPTDAKVQAFSGAWDPWFYMHVQEKTKTVGQGKGVSGGSEPFTVTEYIPLAEYLFRYDRGGFWVGRSAFRYFFMVPFNRLSRWFLDDFLHTRMMYRALHASSESQTFIVQDLALPFETAEKFVDYTAEEFGIWPLWLCPLKRGDAPTFHPFTTPPSRTAAAREGEEAPSQQQLDPIDCSHMLNVGLWGPGPFSRKRFLAKNRGLEAKLRELGGMKWLYAHTYYDEPDFWDIYGGREWYDELRKKYRATTLPTVYDKVKIEEEAVKTRDKLKLFWPVGGLYGVWKSIQSRDYLLHRKSEWKYKPETEA